MEHLIEIDRQLLLTLNGYHNSFFDVFMWLVSSTTIWIPFFATLGFILIKNKQREAFLALAIIAVTVALTDQISSSLLKPLFERFRPTHDPVIGSLVHIVNGYKGGCYGFVSSHAANTFGFALFTSLLLKYRSYTITAFCYALLSSYSRIYLGVHFVGDIIGGIWVGSLCAAGTFGLYYYLERNVFNFRISYQNPIYTSTGYSKSDIKYVTYSFLITLVFIALASLRIKSI